LVPRGRERLAPQLPQRRCLRFTPVCIGAGIFGKLIIIVRS
jgi:hypothetical protein